jgi:hypothetical protein
MAWKRLTLADLAFGEPLRWDIFGPGEHASGGMANGIAPLLQKGQLIAPGPQLDGWLASGLYAEHDAPLSVLHNINVINRQLESVLLDLMTKHGADGELRGLATELVAAVEVDADVALACIFLNQIAGLYAVRHCVEAAIIVAVIAIAMNKSRAETVLATAAALTMNVSMVRQTEGFQGKHSALSNEERAVVRRHPSDSVDLLRGAGVNDQEWLSYVLLHHENEDGSGYPKGKRGEEIPQNAKLISLADKYCAHVSARNYRRSILPDLALNNLFTGADMPADVALARHFIEQIGKYPPGSLVKLESGELGVVATRIDDGAQTIYALRDAGGKAVTPPQPRLTSSRGCAIIAALPEDELGVRFSMKAIWGDLAAL